MFVRNRYRQNEQWISQISTFKKRQPDDQWKREKRAREARERQIAVGKVGSISGDLKK